MKETREIFISQKVFSAQDLQRIAKIFEMQRGDSSADSYIAINYRVFFSNNTTLEADLPELFDDETLAGPGRPLAIAMSFRQLEKPRRSITLQIEHGNGNPSYRNRVEINGEKSPWLSGTFLSLKEAIDTVPPQDFWFGRHGSLLLGLIGFGLGSLYSFAFKLVACIVIGHWPADESLPFLHPTAVRYIANLACLTVIGSTFGGPGLRAWLLSLWPSIEFRFGSAHLQTEQTKRRRLTSVIGLIVIPILANLVSDALKAFS